MASDDGYIVVPQLDGAKYLHGRDFSRVCFPSVK